MRNKTKYNNLFLNQIHSLIISYMRNKTCIWTPSYPNKTFSKNLNWKLAGIMSLMHVGRFLSERLLISDWLIYSRSQIQYILPVIPTYPRIFRLIRFILVKCHQNNVDFTWNDSISLWSPKHHLNYLKKKHIITKS